MVEGGPTLVYSPEAAEYILIQLPGQCRSRRVWDSQCVSPPGKVVS